ncbi:efflux RND transporter periplasmic adaptor subunit [Vreelandella neptunia]|uniref:Efflux RND transporter periplasmic adaptor subunit n=1 Tax=Vreelandella neptunia TaxID=115551 RepID=A0ABZ0YHH0_9GAMM|nr:MULTISPECIES: efflux RND transporter periplasmic adaptor subunit [Halomonas]MBF60165.1 efflux transporter periplasmic adaptor subunit [Halomonas sp.]MDN3559674.1 efflux RND transporter periplasmic adaptor subunit [Halomonas neptunia]TDV99989.1 RND family efflux transporter MFP subunit [Halomonas alkaliantarctica]WQH11549.1 efflux RND transporter periplasmic adaptor subunit [Halomonas neptunia]
MTLSRYYATNQHGRIRLGAVVALLILITTLALAWWIVTQPPRIERTPPPEPLPSVVDVVTVSASDQAPNLYAFGRVEAEQETMLASRVAGQLERFADNVVPGQVVEQQAPVAYIDQADLALSLEDAEAQLANAQAQLALEQAEQQRARSEYESFGRQLSAERRSLVLREPQLRQAQAQVTQARVARDQAALNVDRATLTAPWRAMVQERLVGAGSLLSQGTEVVHLVGVEQFWVRASLPGEWTEWLEAGSSVTLTSRGWPEGATREGTLVSMLPSLEENGLQAQLLIAVNDPLALETDGPALRLGDVLRASFQPAIQEQLISLPSAALRPGDVAWRVDEENRLRRTPVTLAYRGEDDALIRSGLEPGQQVVTAGLAQPREGQLVRIRRPNDTPAQAGDEPGDES